MVSVSASSSIATGIAGWPANSPPPGSVSPLPTTPSCASTTWERAHTLANGLSPDVLHRVLDRYAQQCCPVVDVFAQSYHWSFMQVEYATDLVFRSPTILKPLYQQLSRQAILTVKAEHVATFLGHRITAQLTQEIGSQFATRIEGTCVRHRFGKSSIKIYDKFGLVLRLETTTNDVSAFKHYRKVEHRQGPATRAFAPVRKTIYSLIDLRQILLGCNRRYLEYLSSLDDFSAGIRALDRLTQPRPVKGRTLKGLNFFSRVEQSLLPALQRPGFNIAGLRRADLRPLLTQCSPATLSRQLARLRQLGVIKRVTGTTATTSPALAAPPLLLAAASPNTPSFLLSPDESAHKMQPLRS